jgi:hypothetical protein
MNERKVKIQEHSQTFVMKYPIIICVYIKTS